MEALRDDWHIVRYDWRGHGETDAPEGPYTLAQFVGDAVGLMDALDFDRVHWVGISTGGMIGQGLGIHAPDRIADRVAGRILLVVLVLLGLWATAVVKFGVPGLYIPALGLVPVISTVIVAITMGR